MQLVNMFYGKKYGYIEMCFFFFQFLVLKIFILFAHKLKQLIKDLKFSLNIVI